MPRECQHCGGRIPEHVDFRSRYCRDECRAQATRERDRRNKIRYRARQALGRRGGVEAATAPPAPPPPPPEPPVTAADGSPYPDPGDLDGDASLPPFDRSRHMDTVRAALAALDDGAISVTIRRDGFVRAAYPRPPLTGPLRLRYTDGDGEVRQVLGGMERVR